MKTIFISILQAVEVKNLLRTGVVNKLLERPDVRVVCVARYTERLDYYRSEFKRERLEFVSIPTVLESRAEKFFSALKFHLIKTKTTDLRRRMNRADSSNPVMAWMVYAAGMVLNWVMAKSAMRRLARWLDLRLVGSGGFGELLDKYKPDVVFLANLFDDLEIALLREAKRRTVASVGFINTWDKLTARCALRLLPDKLAVYNEVVKEEAVWHADFSADNIAVCGIPQYDIYFNSALRSRESTMKNFGFDPGRKLIVFGPIGSYFGDSDWQVIDMLYRLIYAEKKIINAELLVRFQPNDFVDEAELKRRPTLKYDLPGIRYGSRSEGDWDMTERDMEKLRDELAAAAVVVSYASSLSIDAAAMGKPAINLDFEVIEDKRRKESKKPTFYYHTEHYTKALATGGIRLVKSEGELVEAINGYISNPDLDKAARERLVKEQCFQTDGKASERVAQSILNEI